MKIVFEEELKGPTGPIGKLGALPRCPKCGAYHLMWDPETDISKCRCCGYENIEEARQNFEKQLKRGERSADEAKAYTIRKENAVPFTVDEPADDEWLKKHAEDMKKMLKSSVVMGRIYADIDKQAAITRTELEDRILCEWQLKRADVEDALREREAYRATGLTPELVRETAELAIWVHDNGIEKIKEWIKADKDGRLVVLPCKVGDTVWFKTYTDNGKTCVGMRQHKVVSTCAYIVVEGKILPVELPLSGFGKNWFLACEEAEKALEEGRA